jgi:cytochrome b subunit of formate dehydrogenase
MMMNKIQLIRSKYFSFLLMLITLPSMIALAQTVDECLSCHEDTSLTTERNGKIVSLFVDRAVQKRSPHAKLICTACHTGFDAQNVPHKEKIEPVNCLICHNDAPAKHLFHASLLKAKGRDVSLVTSCKQCHGTHNIVATKSVGSKFYGAGLTETCGKCHAREKELYLTSTHGKAAASGIISVPNCISCHQNRITGLKDSKDSSSIKIAQEKMCLSCHLDNSDVRARVAPSAKFIAAYEHSVHGSALLRGNGAAANCVDCHGSHAIQREREMTSTVNRSNIPATCAKCHGVIEKEYAGSIHGKSALNGNKEAPVCTNCHGEHNILAPSDPASPTAPRNVSQQVCSPCHNSVTLNEKYGIAGNRFQTYDASYHGLAIRSGSVQVANCASCHGVHNIKPSSDSTSSVSKSNLAVTCGKCHPGANNRFTIGSVHVAMETKEDPLLYWISYIYVLLISTIIGGMVLHNLLDFYRKSKRKLMIRRGLETEEHVGHTLYVRMTLTERIQHAALLISFFMLVVTGFMLRYPDAFWVVAIRNLNSGIFDLRGVLHRVAAVVLVTASMYHLYYIFFTNRGKQLLKDLLPRWNDVTDAVAVLKYNFGLSKTKPKFGRFSYIEKSEYWALVWGNVIMVVTGLILWFDNTFMGLLTKLGWDVSRTVHFYEAWLAFLAILVWHFYFVIFNPDMYPMNLAWLKGTITEAEMADEHPLELEALKRKKLEEDDAMIIVDSKENSNGNCTNIQS